MGRQEQVINCLVDEEVVDVDTAEELCSSRGDDAATALLVDTDVDEDTLLHHLALCFDLPPAGYGEGLFVERDLLESLDAELIREYEIFPVRRRGDERVDILVVEPLNELAVQILEEKLDVPVRQYVWPRMRFLQALHFFLGDDVPDWARSYLRAHPVSMGFATVDGDVDMSEALKTSASLHVLRWNRGDVREFIESCFDRDTLLKVLLGYAGHWLASRLIVVVGKKGIQPYFVEDWPALKSGHDDVERLRDIRVETATDAIAGSDAWRGGDATSLGLTPLFDALDIDPPSSLVAVPVHIGSRPAMSIIGVPTDRDAALRLDDDVMEHFDVDGLKRAAEWVGGQLQALITLAKKDALPPPADRVPPLPRPDRNFGLGVEESLIEQTIARRQDQDKKRHRWEIVDISEVIEESASEQESTHDQDAAGGDDETSEPKETDKTTEDETSKAETDDAASKTSTLSEEDSPVIGAVAAALAGSHSREEPIPESTPDSASDVGATSYGMPSLDDELSEDLIDDAGNDNQPIDEAPDSEPDDGASTRGDDKQRLGAEQSDSMLPDSFSDAADNGRSQKKSSPQTHQVTPFPPGPSQDISEAEPAINNTPSSDVLVADSEEMAEGESSDNEGPTTSENFSSSQVVASEEGATFSDDADATEEADADTTTTVGGPSGLQIPTDASGVPMAQILRRPRPNASSDTSIDDDEPCDDIDDGDDGDDNDDDEEAITGRTMPGTGRITHLDVESSVDEIHNTAQGGHTNSRVRPQATVNLGGDTSSTQSFGELVDDMAPDLSSDSSSPFEHRPQTVPAEVIEEISETGPTAVDLEQSLAFIDDADPDKAFAAAEHLATAGADVIPALKSLFPGRLFVDRYQYTADTLPPVNEHGPVLEALVRIGEPSLEVVKAFVDHTSPEYRFYATYLLTELPAAELLPQLRDQLFDRDRQTRKVARNIVIVHRHLDDYESTILSFLRGIIDEGKENFRLEIAADILCHFKDVTAIPLLIEALDGAGDHLRKTLHRALRQITYQQLAPSPSEWRRWWHNQDDDKRWKWLAEAINHDDPDIRMMAFDELEQIPGLELDYHPDQPPKLRARAQKELTEFFERHDR